MRNFLGKFLPTKIFGRDGSRSVDVIFDEVSNLHRLAVDQVVKVESLRGFSDIADNWIFINSVGAVGDTLEIQIDSSDGALAATGLSTYSKTFTILVTDTRQTLTDRIVAALNADITFNPAYRAVRVKDSPIVIIKTKFFGEWGEVLDSPGVPSANAFRVVLVGTLNIVRAFPDFIRRNKINSLSTDPRDERFGVLGISGNVSNIPASVGNLYQEFFTNPTYGTALNQNLLGSSATWTVPISADRDISILELRLFFGANRIRLGEGKFGSTNSPLTGGIYFDIKADNILKTIGPFKSNSSLKNEFALGDPTNFRLDIQSGRDELLASFTPGAGFVLRQAGTFGPGNDDYIRLRIENSRLDNRVSFMRAIAFGFGADL